MGTANLSTFIRENNHPILSDWEAFARTLTQGASLDGDGLRDHAEAMLDDIAGTIEAAQAERDRAKITNLRQCDARVLRDGAAAASEHGRHRADNGFSVVDMVAEFRALRTNVTRLWIAQCPQFGREEVEALVCFNEAVDRAIAESLERYAVDMDQARQRFLAILSHDLRNPVAAISTAASFLADVGDLNDQDAKLVGVIRGATTRMTNLISDMLELALHRLGDTMPVDRGEMNLDDVVNAVVAEIGVSYPNASILVSARGDLHGKWDSARLAQALTNLIGNAVQHGDTGQPIRVCLRGDANEVTLIVRNHGDTIPREQLRRMFDGGKPAGQTDGERRHLGLGLFIVNRIVDAHSGSIDVDSANGETAFTIHLPRAA
jgi:signal transduction histidine kinase